jgi:phosphinothricin acetyltransferase
MIIRQARMGDASEICAITNAVINDKAITFTTKERNEAAIAADIVLRWTAYLVGEIDGQVLGFATFSPFRASPGYVKTKEVTINLAPQARGRGMGRALMQGLEEVAIAQGVHVLVAGISGSNPVGASFHTACGYVEVGRMPQVGYKAGEWQDLILMQKMLPESDSGLDSGPNSGADSAASAG